MGVGRQSGGQRKGSREEAALVTIVTASREEAALVTMVTASREEAPW